jgi:nucleotide-binding universal stress UspA family protein
MVRVLIKKILVALDGSSWAVHALDFALELAQQCSAEIQLITVVPPLFLPMHSMNWASFGLVEINSPSENFLVALLDMAEEKVRQDKTELKVSAKIEYGIPQEKIVETATKGHFDLIVMGKRGLGMKFTIGSVSCKVAEDASCPVLIVK